jgi:secernin
MGFDMVVALPGTTPDGQTLFGHNGSRPGDEGQALHRQSARAHAPGEALIFGSLAIPQARQTHSILGWQSAGQWGYRHGLNEHRVVAGCNPIQTRLQSEGAGLSGPDLVRIALERGTSARQARDVILDLICRHGQAGIGSEEPNSSFLVADLKEAFVLETSGKHWAEQEIHAVRAVSDVCHLHQDWDRISRGLADLAISRGWWPEDGSKLDFANVVAPTERESAPSLRRWGRATLLLEQNSGRLDRPLFRRLLCDHFENSVISVDAFDSPLLEQSICNHGAEASAPLTAMSFIAELNELPVQLPIAWCAFGPPCSSAYFPIPLLGDLPPALRATANENGCAIWRTVVRLLSQCRHDPIRWQLCREEMARVQIRFDENCRDLLLDATQLRAAGKGTELERLTESFMQHNVEYFTEVCEKLAPTGDCRQGVLAGPTRTNQDMMMPMF